MNQIMTQTQSNAASFSIEEISLIKDTICKGATDNELKLFLNQCKATGLNPLARQIYSVERKENRDGEWKKVRSIQVSIDGFRLIAERSGKYAGQTAPLWCGEDGVWIDVWLKNVPPVAAKIGVLRSDFKEPCWGVARFDAYAQKKNGGGYTRMWEVMGDVMIAKCAESLALRKAFPQELSGLYTSDEMAQADIEPSSNIHISATSGEITAKQAFGSAKAMKDRWNSIRDSMMACKTISELEKVFIDSKIDFASFKSVEPQMYDNLIQIGVQRRNAISSSENNEDSTFDDEEVPAYIKQQMEEEKEFLAAKGLSY